MAYGIEQDRIRAIIPEGFLLQELESKDHARQKKTMQDATF